MTTNTMSLFPAYSGENDLNPNGSEQDAGPSWLANSSYQKEITRKHSDSTQTSSESSEDDSTPKHKRKKRKKKTKEVVGPKEMLYFEDSSPMTVKETHSLPQIQLSKPLNSDYNKKKRPNTKKKKRKKNENRYFLKSLENKEELEVLNPEPLNIEEFLKRTEMFNKNLRADPRDVKMWIDYVKLQDLGAGTLRGRGEKKLSILDKALEANPESEELLNQKMMISELIFPIDKVGTEAKNIVSKFPKNLTGWQWVLNSSQYNLSKMTAPGVLLTYEQVLHGVNKAHHDSKPFLDFLLQCGLFLRQCGLWEQLTALLELYLEHSLTSPDSGVFKVGVSLPLTEIQEVEDGILRSGLPLGALWLRVERLREGLHFRAVEESEDPQRVVFKEDVAPLLFPVSPSASSRLALTALLLLKVPPLPSSHAFRAYTRLDAVSWALDSPEDILAANFSPGDASYLNIVPDLLVGPQYLLDNLGRAEYFSFVNNVFEKCIENIKEDKTCFQIWQMRWWRWIYGISKMNNSEDSALKKQFLGFAKKMLKQNRDSIPLYSEYALLEYELGDFDSALKVLETAMSLRDPPLLVGIIFKRDMCNLYLLYIELLIKKDKELYREKILSTLIALAFGEAVKRITIRDEIVEKCKERFSHISMEVTRGAEDREVCLRDVMCPDFVTAWIRCHAWFLYLTQGPWEALSLFSTAMSTLSVSADSPSHDLHDVIQEGLHEGLIQIFYDFSTTSPGNNDKLYELAYKAFNCYPNNPFFLNILYSCEVAGLKWSKLSGEVVSTGGVLPSALVYFMTHARLTRDDSLRASAPQRLHALIERLRDVNERCPFFWRLLLQASSLKDSEHIKRTFYNALEKCPWVKVLYYEAAKILPAELPEIQDLIVEKELRLHITPEELEILRQEG